MIVIVALISLTTLFFVAGGLSKDYAQRVRESTVAATRDETTSIGRFLEQSINLYANLARSLIFATDLKNKNQSSLMLEGVWKANKAVVMSEIYAVKDNSVVSIGFSSTEYTSPNISAEARPKLIKQIQDFNRQSVIEESGKKIKNQKVLLKNLTKGVETPIMQLLIRVPMVIKTDLGESTEEYFVFFNLIPESLTSMMINRGENFAISIFNFNKKSIFSTINARNKLKFQSLSNSAFESLIRDDSPLPQLEQRVENKGKKPVQINYLPLRNFQLMIVTQKILESEKAHEEKSIKKIFWNALMAFVIAFIFIYAYSSKIANRIGRLQNGTVLIASGQFHQKTDVGGKDEVGVLSKAIDKMAKDLETLVIVREQASRQEAELKMAENVQKTLVPENNLTRNRIRTDFLFRPASECAGDWWGRFPISNEEELIVIADATGHGAHSALIAALAHAYFSTFEKGVDQPRLNPTPPTKMLEGLNTILYESGKGSLSMTALAMIINQKTRQITCANGAHCFPQIINSKEMKQVTIGGDILGISKGFSCQQKEFVLGPDERMMIYSDGLFECKNSTSEMIKKRQFRQFMTSRNTSSNFEIVEDLSTYINKFFENTTLSDDITTVLIEIDSASSIFDASHQRSSSPLKSAVEANVIKISQASGD